MKKFLMLFAVLVAGPVLVLAAPAPPDLTVTEPDLPLTVVFTGIEAPAVPECVASQGAALNFSWEAVPGTPNGSIVGYRYGWNLVNPEDPLDPGWASSGYDPDLLAAPTWIMTVGYHSFYVEVQDGNGNLTRGCIHLIETTLPAENTTWSEVKSQYR